MLQLLTEDPLTSPFGLFAMAWWTVMGMLVGSYLNVVAYRLPLGRSTVAPRSQCPGCDGAIRWFDNIPVLSWLLLQGRCRHCKTSISVQYPLVELTTGVLFAATFARFGYSADTLIAAVFASLMLVLALIDVEHFLLPDKLTYPGIAIGLAAAFVSTTTTPRDAALGALAGAGLLLGMIGGWYLVRREQGMGFGDVKMLALMGAFLGLSGMVMSLFFAAFAGSVVGVALMVKAGNDMKLRLPFGVFLAAGALISLFVGEPLLAWYLRAAWIPI